MIRGVSFQITQEKTNIIWKILQDVLIESYIWYLPPEQTEIWEAGNDEPFSQNIYEGKDFRCLAQKMQFVPIFMKLQAYVSEEPYSNIQTYTDFLKSNCTLILLIYDCENVEVYAKSESVATAIFQRAVCNGYRSVRYITEENDGRTSMDIC